MSDCYIEKRKIELEQLIRFRAHIPVLNSMGHFSKEALTEIGIRVDARISACKISIRDFQTSKAATKFS
jgi:hypothetical protein